MPSTLKEWAKKDPSSSILRGDIHALQINTLGKNFVSALGMVAANNN
jgi:hypothetical protein